MSDEPKIYVMPGIAFGSLQVVALSDYTALRTQRDALAEALRICRDKLAIYRANGTGEYLDRIAAAIRQAKEE